MNSFTTSIRFNLLIGQALKSHNWIIIIIIIIIIIVEPW